MSTTLQAYVESSTELALLRGTTNVTLSREVGGLYDPSGVEPVPIEVSGVHSLGATTLTIAPQTGAHIRGKVGIGATVSVAGHGTSYTTTAEAIVDETAPETLALTITPPGLEAGLTGGEVVTIGGESNVTYSAQPMSDKAAASRRWDTGRGSSMWKMVHDGTTRVPQLGDIASGGVVGSVINVDTYPGIYSVVQVGVGT